MPNWCQNTLVLKHEDPVMIKRAEDSFAKGAFLNEFIPVPKSLHIVAGRVGDPDEQKKLNEQEELNREIYGYANWYDYCVNEWGTKWDIGHSDGINDVKTNEIVFYFDSAWSPPTIAYEKLIDLGFTVEATYYEGGMSFCGTFDMNGDQYYDLSDLNATEVASTIPSELDMSYGISEQMAEMEREAEDDVTAWYKDGVEEVGLEPHVIKKDNG
jgi:hypothetical protein